MRAAAEPHRAVQKAWWAPNRRWALNRCLPPASRGRACQYSSSSAYRVSILPVSIPSTDLVSIPTRAISSTDGTTCGSTTCGSTNQWKHDMRKHDMWSTALRTTCGSTTWICPSSSTNARGRPGNSEKPPCNKTSERRLPVLTTRRTGRSGERDCNDDFQLPLAFLSFQNALPSSSCHWRSFSLAAAPWTASRLRFRAR